MTNKSTGWTKEKRARVAKRTQNQQPWKHSTGPKTTDGKAKVAQNAYQHGFFSRDYKAVMDLLNMQAAFVNTLNHDKVEE
jgi:uncharacterized protein YozE (UPF0346 family)